MPLVPSQEAKSFQPTITKVVAATHDTSYQNDAGGIKASSRWLSEATPPVIRSKKKAAGTPAGVQDLMSRRRPVVSSLPLLNHRLLAEIPPASARSKSAIHGREEYNRLDAIFGHVATIYENSKGVRNRFEIGHKRVNINRLENQNTPPSKPEMNINAS